MFNPIIQSVDINNPVDVQFICRQHLKIPEIWIPDYTFTTEELVEEQTRFNNDYREGKLICLIARVEQQIIGFIWAENSNREKGLVTIMSLWTAPEFRRQGVATLLKQELETAAKSQGYQKIRTSVYAPNNKMLDLNLKLGYQIKRYTLEKVL